MAAKKKRVAKKTAKKKVAVAKKATTKRKHLPTSLTRRASPKKMSVQFLKHSTA